MHFGSVTFVRPILQFQSTFWAFTMLSKLCCLKIYEEARTSNVTICFVRYSNVVFRCVIEWKVGNSSLWNNAQWLDINLLTKKKDENSKQKKNGSIIMRFCVYRNLRDRYSWFYVRKYILQYRIELEANGRMGQPPQGPAKPQSDTAVSICSVYSCFKFAC